MAESHYDDLVSRGEDECKEAEEIQSEKEVVDTCLENATEEEESLSEELDSDARHALGSYAGDLAGIAGREVVQDAILDTAAGAVDSVLPGVGTTVAGAYDMYSAGELGEEIAGLEGPVSRYSSESQDAQSEHWDAYQRKEKLEEDDWALRERAADLEEEIGETREEIAQYVQDLGLGEEFGMESDEADVPDSEAAELPLDESVERANELGRLDSDLEKAEQTMDSLAPSQQDRLVHWYEKHF